MVGKSDWSSIGEEEDALLRRCRKFLRGSPDSPGGGAKDILYFTPNGRWLRICSREAYEQVLGAGNEELAFLIDSGKARELFDNRRIPLPSELTNPSRERDYEVATDFKESLATPPSSLLPGFHYPAPRDAHDILGAEEAINRNSLVDILRNWEELEWGIEEVRTKHDANISLNSPEQDSTFQKAKKLTPVQKEILSVIPSSGQGFTQQGIFFALRKNNTRCSNGSIKLATPKLKKLGLVEYIKGPGISGFLRTEKGQTYLSESE